MTFRIRSVLFLSLLAALGTSALPACGQSIFATEGLGYQLDPLDGRSSGLGGVALGFPEPEISWANPASAIGLIAPGLSLSYQYDNFSTDTEGTSFEGETARFPLLLATFPAGQRFVILGGFGSYLDQNWRVQEPDTLEFGGDSIAVVDLITSEGGVTRLRFGGAYHIGGGLGVGLVADFHTGTVRREEGRSFDPERQLNDTLIPSRWRYSGVGYTVGAHYSPSQVGGVGISLTYGGTLEAKVRDGPGNDRSYDLPLSVRIGGTGRILPTLLVALGGSWSGWSSVDGDLVAGATARDAWSLNGGIEWEGISIREQTIPIRLGARTAALPFHTTGDGVTERAASTGIGVPFAGGAVRPDVSVEFGNRSNGALDETFWRAGVSIRVFGR